MSMNKSLLIVIVIVLIISSFLIGYSVKSSNSNDVENVQENAVGFVFGKITLKSGNCIPTGDSNTDSTCNNEGVSRTIYIREVVGSYVQYMEDFYYLKSDAPQKLIKTAISDSEGNFRVELPIGMYSIFVEDAGRERCDISNADGMCVIEILDNQEFEYNLTIDNAVY